MGRADRTCLIEGCTAPYRCSGYCRNHYQLAFNHGELPPPPTLSERLWRKIAKVGTCWEWQGSLNNRGYGQVAVGGRKFYTHRVMYELLVEPIPAGLELDHLCRNRRCCNPAHLEPVTPKENNHRGLAGPKTHCIRGHEFTPENTYLRQGWKSCRACRDIRNRGGTPSAVENGEAA